MEGGQSLDARRAARSRPPVIDTHAHWYPQAWIDLLEKEGPKQGAQIVRNEQGLLTYTTPKFTAVFAPRFVEIAERLKTMDAQEVDVHALSLSSPMVYWATPDLGLGLSQAFNDSCVQAHREHPERFVGMAMLPMQDPALALQELERVSTLPGMRGLYLSTFPAQREMDAKEYFPIYAKCEEIGWPIFLHPVDTIGPDRTAKYYLRNLLGNPYDTGVAAAHLIFGGVLDAFPELQVMLPHAGGTFPWLSGRFDRGVAVRPELKHMKQPASAYLRRFHYDTITHSAKVLSYLIQLVGADRVVLGSDYCYDMGHERPVQVLDAVPDLSTQQRQQILSDNAARLLNI